MTTSLIHDQRRAALITLLFDKMPPTLNDVVNAAKKKYPADEDLAQLTWINGAIYGVVAAHFRRTYDDREDADELCEWAVSVIYAAVCELVAEEVWSEENDRDFDPALMRLPGAFTEAEP